jgi:hypothetical protein
VDSVGHEWQSVLDPVLAGCVGAFAAHYCSVFAFSKASSIGPTM